MKSKLSIIAMAILISACILNATECDKNVAGADTGKDKSCSKIQRDNTCGTSNAGCTRTVTSVCLCVQCTATETVSCPCVKITDDSYQETFHGSCVECSAGAEASGDNWKVSAGGKWYMCTFSDPASGTDVQDLQCSR